MRRTGKVKWYDGRNGYGFIEEDGGKQVVVYHSDIRSEGDQVLTEGQEVDFMVLNTRAGAKASDVVVRAPLRPARSARR